MAKYRLHRPYHKRNEPIQGYRTVDHPLYATWSNMIGRCSNPDDTNYANYGARGITVCARWRKSFAAFAADMGQRPTPEHSIDRRDNSKGYSPANCKWATRIEQAQNKRTYITSSTGAGGVLPTKAGNFIARWNYNGARFNLGRYPTIEAATLARNEFIVLYFVNREAAMKMTERRARHDSTTGVRGITPHADGGYTVRKTVDGVRKYLGYRKTYEEALALWTEHN
jgi:hypothetical protein